MPSAVYAQKSPKHSRFMPLLAPQQTNATPRARPCRVKASPMQPGARPPMQGTGAAKEHQIRKHRGGRRVSSGRAGSPYKSCCFTLARRRFSGSHDLPFHARSPPPLSLDPGGKRSVCVLGPKPVGPIRCKYPHTVNELTSSTRYKFPPQHHTSHFLSPSPPRSQSEPRGNSRNCLYSPPLFSSQCIPSPSPPPLQSPGSAPTPLPCLL